MPIYDSCSIYLQTATSLQEKIVKLDAVIDALFTAATEAAENQGIDEYSLDDGQTKIRTRYRNSTEVFKAIKDYETLRTMYQNRLNGRQFSLRDRTTFLNRGNV